MRDQQDANEIRENELLAALPSALGKCPDGKTNTTRYSSYFLADIYGGTHSLPTLQADSQQCYPEILSACTSDGSGYCGYLQNSGLENYITDRGGNKIARTTFTDTNGNVTSFSQTCIPADCGSAGEAFAEVVDYTDPTNNTPLTETISYSAGYPNYHIVSDSHAWTDAAGDSRAFTINYSSYSQKTSFGCSNSGQYPLDATNASTQWLPSSITAPDGKYTISYETSSGYTTGRISKVVFPSGASLAYSYTGGNSGISCVSNPTYSLLVPVLQRTSTDTQGVQRIWKYDTTQIANATVVTDPSGNDTVYTFGGATGLRSQYETERVYYQGSRKNNSVLKTQITCYNGNTTNWQTSCPGTYVASTTISQKDVYTTLAGMTQYTQLETTYDADGNLTESKTYDFNRILLSDHLITYGTYSNGSCSSITGIFDRVCTDIMKDGSSNIIARTNYAYDTHGNRTSTSQLSGGSTYLSSSTSYNANGTVNVATDINGIQTTYNSYVCNGNFATAISEPLGLSKSMTWDCNGGVVTSITDENSNQSTITYVNSTTGVADPFYRPISTKDPIGNITTYAYTPTTFESAMNFNGTISTVDILTTSDGFGHTILEQKRQGQGSTSFDTIQYAYDGNFRQYSVSIPCPAKAGSGCSEATTTSTYDGVGRPLIVKDGGGGTANYSYTRNDTLVTVGPPPSGENAKSRQMEYDALGRLTSTCEITAGTTTWPGGNCAQANPQTGYWSTYSYDALNGLDIASLGAQSSTPQARAYSYDSLGRVTQSKTPEAGTWTYYYDTAACPNSGASAGNLTCSTDANGVTTVYFYDGLSRLHDVNAIGSYCRRFRYDSGSTSVTGSVPSGVTLANISGRMFEAETDNCINPITPITDEWFSYDADGNMTDLWEMTPHSGGYYHTSIGYFANGAVGSLSGIPGYAAYTYTVDGEGRPTTVTQSTSSIVGSVGYDESSNPTTITYFNGDTDKYSYDPLTERMKNYTFNVASTSDSGTLNWNANGTLQQLVIVDNVQLAADSQTCTFSYDDLTRILTDNCGSQWSQTFSYDPFGNVSKTGNPGGTWLPGYNSANNRYSSIGATYDADGHLTYDSFNTYTWDGYGKMASVQSGNSAAACGSSGTCITYDANGRPVEKNVAGVFSEILYSPLGETAIMNGASTVTVSYIPMPGGGYMWANTAGGVNQVLEHRDWIGNVRLEVNPGLGVDTTRSVHAYAPFGETYDIYTNCCGTVNFTGDKQDLFTGLFDTPNRELSPNQGRWISPDPASLQAVDPTNPQTWNSYAYVLNNPLSYIDPTGLYCAYLNDAGNGVENIDSSGDNAECGYNGGYWIGGQYGGGSWINVNADSGTVMGLGYDSNGNREVSVAGAVGSNLWGAWTQTFNSPGIVSSFQSGAANNSSWGWNFTKAFFGGLVSSAGWKAVYHSFGEGGCDRLMATTFAGDFIPYPTDDTPGPTDAVEPAAKFLSAVTYNQGLNYAASQGLTYPLKSSVFRGFMDTSETIEGSVPAVTAGVATVHAVTTAGLAAYNGECH